MKQTSKQKTKKGQYQVGDILVRFGKLYKIFKIKNIEAEGKEQKYLFYRLIFKTNYRQDVICSIPLANIEKTNIRRPLDIGQFKKFIKDLSKDIQDKKIDVNKEKSIVYSEDLEEKSNLLSRLWCLKQDKEKNFNSSMKNLSQEVVNSVVEELAYLFDITVKEAEEKIYLNLQAE
jgi:RNA polymerase-interacting CarD/CdnL/TRCF family regulator